MAELATFGAGCFWHVEEAFRQIPGVIDTAAGYMGGSVQYPTYEEVCSDRTGHAEVVQVTFDPEVVSYDELLDVFWSIHDPTQLNRQGPDVGRQYRSVIFYHGPEQRDLALESQKEVDKSNVYGKPSVTEILPAQEFWKAEEYHQRYLEKNGLAGCPV